jgi:hypothetical protein
MIPYNYLIADNIAKTILTEYSGIKHVNLYLDLNISEHSRNHFNSYFSEKISWLSSTEGITDYITNNVYHVYSHDEPCIQVADYLAGSLFRSYESDNSAYYEMILHKVKHTTSWGL